MADDQTSPLLELQHVSKTYPGPVHALVDVNIAVQRGEIVCLLGPSGCGKSTLLRVVAGLEQIDQGRTLFRGQGLQPIPVHERGFGLMFQDFALFPHRTVAQNIEFGLRMAGSRTQQRRSRVAEMLELVNLPGYGGRTVSELSGGERQRVALARSLAPNPALLMLDEPLGSLDRGLRDELVEELRTILHEMEVTALYVTHDQDEALALGDQLVVMHAGHIEQVGHPAQVYAQPATIFVANFLGLTNLIDAAVAAGETAMLQTTLGPFPDRTSAQGHGTLLIRPEAAILNIDRVTQMGAAARDRGRDQPKTEQGFQLGENGTVYLHGTLQQDTFHGDHYRIRITVTTGKGEETLNFQLPAYQADSAGNLQPITLPPRREPISLIIHPELTTWLGYT